MQRPSRVLVALATVGAVTAGGAAALADSSATSPNRTRPEADTTATGDREALSAAQLSHASVHKHLLEEAVRNARQALLARQREALLASRAAAAAALAARQAAAVSAVPTQSPTAYPTAYPTTAANAPASTPPMTHASTGASGGTAGHGSDDGTGDDGSGDD
jgi:hypothetical protein